MNHLSIDIETYSSVDIKKYGLYKYALSPDFQILLLAFKWDAMTTYIYDFMQAPDPFQLAVLQQALQDPNVVKHAYNAAFEWFCLNRAGLVTPIEQWRCTQAHGMYCGLPAGLGNIGRVIGLPEDKQKLGVGAALIRLFCIPQKPTRTNGNRTRILPKDEPQKWQLFKDYCMQDVEAEYETERRLAPWPMPEREQKLWQLDCTMNAHGVKVDMQLVSGALSCASRVSEDLTREAMAISGLDNPKSVQQLTEWLNEELEDELPGEITDLRKETVKDLLKKGVNSEAATRMLEIRQQISKTSTRKYDTMAGAVCADGRIRGMLQYYGANRTGRWAGRMVQIHNLPRNYLKTLDYARQLTLERNTDMLQLMYGNVPDTLSQLIRTAFVPAPGHLFLVADFSAIEARVIAWLAGEEWRLNVFRTHGKIYEASAEQMFHLEPGSVTKEDPMRQRGKVAELALGFAGGAGALIAMGALREGLTEAELPEIVDRWRAASPRIVQLWKDLNRAAIDAVQLYTPQQSHGLVFAYEYEPATGLVYMTVQLPVGRKLFYPWPNIRENKFDRPAIHYWGVDQDTKKWGLISTFGGKITENVVQAIARDCLAEILLRLEARGYQTVFHVHDEAIAEHPTDELDKVLQIMAEPIPWAPGLPLKGAGFTTAEYYKKD